MKNLEQQSNIAVTLGLIALATIMLTTALVSSSLAQQEPPIIEDDGKLVFAAAGDWSCDSDTEATIAGIQHHDPDIVFALGDLSYNDSAECWFDVSEPIDEKVKFVMGNHDDETQVKRDAYMAHYNLTEEFYSFDIGNVHFLVLSTEPTCDTCTTFTKTEPQYIFALADLALADKNPLTDWIVVSMHKPLYTNPRPAYNDYNVFKIIYHPLFDKYDVDLVLAGHFHNYQRHLPLKFNAANPLSPIITDTAATNTYHDPEGQVYVVVGTGGVALGGHTAIKPYNITYEENHHGFILIEVDNSGLTSTELRGKFYVNDQYPSGADHFTIIKQNRDTYGDGLTLTGSNYHQESSSPSLQLQHYTTAVQFNTCENMPSGSSFLINKGGIGTDASGKNLNYGIWMTDTEQVNAGFETAGGSDYFIKSPKSYNDCHDHYAVNTFDGSTLKLYIDGKLVASRAAAATPDNTGNQPLRIGANALSANGFFKGTIDEARLWNRAITEQEIIDATFNGVFKYDGGQVIYLPFS